MEAAEKEGQPAGQELRLGQPLLLPDDSDASASIAARRIKAS
jgi:hypothetical protein